MRRRAHMMCLCPDATRYLPLHAHYHDIMLHTATASSRPSPECIASAARCFSFPVLNPALGVPCRLLQNSTWWLVADQTGQHVYICTQAGTYTNLHTQTHLHTHLHTQHTHLHTHITSRGCLLQPMHTTVTLQACLPDVLAAVPLCQHACPALGGCFMHAHAHPQHGPGTIP